ncbi:hypothetical protein N7466_008847 [Penicillium verhagenii]|uniref:uncharacterized protein n=1 Tax=Penicillium verhagenii TaxID=1562060 RepID=UPI002545371A|nr:uncharacterized protein N7466_008847 [Penicillium verhagenii]KAJ5924660.1 hypothetical protein N7466_008847 [Penicillium verhagenii]
MPLHLLGKKSWNVYNPENVARVKRDEAQAKALEEEDERRMQEVDAERRIRILRGERVPTPPPPPPARLPSEASTRRDRTLTDDAGRSRKRRRVAGEDDTDRDIRFAREDAEQASIKREELTTAALKKNKSEAPILDRDGHINLFPTEGDNKKPEKNKEAEAEAQKEKRSYEDQYTMRFSNAAGFKQSIGQKPWYSSSTEAVEAPDLTSKNVWGNEDPMRKERAKARMDANDPLAIMKRGVRQLKATEQERKRWNEEKRRELEALRSEQGSRDRRSHQRRKRSRSVDSLEGFKLDSPAAKDQDESHRTSQRSHRRPHHHRERSRDRHRDSSSRRSHHSSGRTHRRRDETKGTHRS